MWKKLLTQVTLSLALLGLFAFHTNAQNYDTPLTNAAVVKLVRAGFKEKTIISIIHSRPNRFQLDSDRLIDLKHNGVSENIILAMLAQNESLALPEDDWSAGGMLNGDGQKSSNGGDIFGSGSSSKSQNGGRGQAGGNDNDITTTGSATVRILRPPTEAGGNGAPKLERTPSLTNDSVIKLVEAGFSEGTIIKRIEESPAEFDLSTPKLEELRRRRVTEAIIIAMTAAMDDGSSTKPVSPARTRGN